MQDKASVQSIDRALSVLEALTGEREGVSLSRIAQRVDLHKSTTHRLLASLCQRGYAERLAGGDYRLGRRVVELASMYLNQLELKTEAQPHLRKLLQQTTQPVHLAVLEGLEVIYIDKMETLHSIRMYSQIGLRSPAYCTGVGKALLSGLDEEELHARLEGVQLAFHTPNTVTDPEALLREIRRVKKRGWACDNEENELGIRCIAASPHRSTITGATRWRRFPHPASPACWNPPAIPRWPSTSRPAPRPYRPAWAIVKNNFVNPRTAR